MTSYTFHQSAELELVDAARYYEARSQGLGRAFLAEVDRAVVQVLTLPLAGEAVLGEVRRKMLRRFPYSLFYAVEPDRVVFLAVAHQKRRPLYWSGRT